MTESQRASTACDYLAAIALTDQWINCLEFRWAVVDLINFVCSQSERGNETSDGTVQATPHIMAADFATKADILDRAIPDGSAVDSMADHYVGKETPEEEAVNVFLSR